MANVLTQNRYDETNATVGQSMKWARTWIMGTDAAGTRVNPGMYGITRRPTTGQLWPLTKAAG